MARDFFQEALARFRNIQYPTTAQRQFDTLRNDLRKDVLSKEFNEARAEYEDLLSGRGLNLTSIDATEGGQRQTIGINPITGATEITTPEYNRLFRSDKTDFNPGGRGAFENIYDVGLGNIDPRTGLPKDKDESDDTDSGLITESGGEREGRDKDQGASSDITHEVINGQAYRINKVTGEVEALEGIDAMIAKTLNAYVTNPYTLTGLLNNITGGNKSYDEKMQDLKNVNENAYNSLTQQVRENYRTQQFNEEEESFFDKITKGIFKDSDKEGDQQTSKETFGQADDDRQTYGAGGQYGGGDGTTNGSTDKGVESGAGGTGGSGATGESDKESDKIGGCFVEGTLIQMADGTTKEITTIKVGEKTKGGIIQAKMEFMPQNIYNYKDVLVSGSHWVVEDNQLIAVEDSKHGVLTDRIEPVYTFKTSNNRIWINNIEFGDFETGSDADWEPHFEMVRQKLNKELRDGK